MLLPLWWEFFCSWWDAACPGMKAEHLNHVEPDWVRGGIFLFRAADNRLTLQCHVGAVASQLFKVFGIRGPAEAIVSFFFLFSLEDEHFFHSFLLLPERLEFQHGSERQHGYQKGHQHQKNDSQHCDDCPYTRRAAGAYFFQFFEGAATFAEQ